MTEPVFRYHPDPVATGSAVRTDHVCGVCGYQRHVRYEGPVYGKQPGGLCLLCIHSGQAAATLGTAALEAGMNAQFSDAVDVPDDVPFDVVEEVTQRTPGFHGWQQPSWLYHCGDGAAFLGPAGYSELEAHADALDMVREKCRQLGWSPQDTDVLLHQLDRAGEPTAYLFQCLHCGAYLASWDIG
ncbi:CbrC family protein [Micromonospora sp. NPDC051006]|uniref:CbrC family protein n=1 Tax=Micromonospora sp. NPDC051006 TaxID=3364283 RepID=UPI0037A17453